MRTLTLVLTTIPSNLALKNEKTMEYLKTFLN